MISLLRNAMSYVHFLVVNFKLVLLKVTILNFSFLELFGTFAMSYVFVCGCMHT